MSKKYEFLIFFVIMMWVTIMFLCLNIVDLKRTLDKSTQSVVQLEEREYIYKNSIRILENQLKDMNEKYATLESCISTKSEDLIVINKQELDLLARCIYSEARDSEKGMRYVGYVILNRVETPLYPKTISGVILEKGQFKVVKNGKISLEPSEQAIKIATDLILYGNQEIPKDVLAFRSKRYHIWKGSIPYCEVGGNYFSILR